ncbi:hypothetical protein H0A36_09165 [Endozoicomonas sp. SM1973]|uniref:YscD cytoplasmic domain-containing protein n=1 Tax=Spartinivicinus marinus TaxID=2994442 RepID=A0A853I3V6_9GAMM|nr:FHA domain-containing protein [Spartinivicinus marinus]MCX4028143.1 hypothetical protein [Spartinivicinus marinus]NYZ66182.1 hypothetical protein [Spartinivicinus marinus]
MNNSLELGTYGIKANLFETAMFELRVLNGLHRGVSLLLDGEQIVIGSSLEADLVLVDPGISEQHISIGTNQAYNDVISDSWLLVKLEGDSWDATGELITEKKCIRKDEKFSVGGVWICVSDTNEIWPMFDQCLYAPNRLSFEKGKETTSSNRLKQKITKLTRYLTLFLVGACVIIYANGYSDSNNTIGSSSAHIKEDIKSTDNQKMLLANFKHMLKERDLDSVSIDVKNKQLRLVGELKPDQLGRLERMLIRFNLQHPNDFIISNHVRKVDRSLPFHIIRVTAGPYAHIVTDDNKRITLGESLDGFRLKSIKGNKLLFDGKHKVEIAW